VQSELEPRRGTTAFGLDCPPRSSCSEGPPRFTLLCFQPLLFFFARWFAMECSTARVMQAAVTHEAASLATHALVAERTRPTCKALEIRRERLPSKQSDGFSETGAYAMHVLSFENGRRVTHL